MCGAEVWDGQWMTTAMWIAIIAAVLVGSFGVWWALRGDLFNPSKKDPSSSSQPVKRRD